MDQDSGSPLNFKDIMDSAKIQFNSTINSPPESSDDCINDESLNEIYTSIIFPDSPSHLYLLEDLTSSQIRTDDSSYYGNDFSDTAKKIPSGVQYNRLDELLTRIFNIDHSSCDKMMLIQRHAPFTYPCFECSPMMFNDRQSRLPTYENPILPASTQNSFVMEPQSQSSWDSHFENTDIMVLDDHGTCPSSSQNDSPQNPQATLQQNVCVDPKPAEYSNSQIGNRIENSNKSSINPKIVSMPGMVATVNGHQYVNHMVTESSKSSTVPNVNNFRIPPSMRGRSPSEILKRSNHNSLERRRREDLRGMLNGLRKIIPHTITNDRSSKVQVVILERSKHYIDELNILEKRIFEEILAVRSNVNSVASRIRQKMKFHQHHEAYAAPITAHKF